MSRKLIPFFLVSAFTLMLSGTAFARRPAALAEKQDEATKVLIQCPQPTTGGYREMLARAALPSSEAALPSSEKVAAQVPARRRMADHSVIACAGETVHTGGGYRDIFVRFEPDTLGPMLAVVRR